MATAEISVSTRPTADEATIVRAVTVIMGTVVGLTFLFGFGNVLNLALRLGVPVWVAPLVAPAVDLSIFGLLLGTRHLALAGATAEQLQPARRLLIFASVVTLALNVADPIVADEYGKAAFDAVGPLLLIGWAEVGPGLLQSMAASCRREAVPAAGILCVHDEREVHENIESDAEIGSVTSDQPTAASDTPTIEGDLLERAKQEDAHHWSEYRRPISAETLRKRLHVGAARSRMLVSMVRAGHVDRPELDQLDLDDARGSLR